jgi:hypothetical protein
MGMNVPLHASAALSPGKNRGAVCDPEPASTFRITKKYGIKLGVFIVERVDALIHGN